jgi:hypothetical protein
MHDSKTSNDDLTYEYIYQLCKTDVLNSRQFMLSVELMAGSVQL